MREDRLESKEDRLKNLDKDRLNSTEKEKVEVKVKKKIRTDEINLTKGALSSNFSSST